MGPIPLPTKIKKFCVIRSSNTFKDSREQFEIRTHKRIIEVLDPTNKTIDALTPSEPAWRRRNRDQTLGQALLI